jgi:hypothetical protein
VGWCLRWQPFVNHDDRFGFCGFHRNSPRRDAWLGVLLLTLEAVQILLSAIA